MGHSKRIRINKRRAAISLIVMIAITTAIVLALYFYISNQPTKLREPVSEVGGIPVITDFIPKDTMEPARAGKKDRVRRHPRNGESGEERRRGLAQQLPP